MEDSPFGGRMASRVPRVVRCAGFLWLLRIPRRIAFRQARIQYFGPVSDRERYTLSASLAEISTQGRTFYRTTESVRDANGTEVMRMARRSPRRQKIEESAE
jgi:hypothetical protein